MVAAAYAETGDFDKAIKYIKQAKEIDKRELQEIIKVRNEMLEAFTNQKPYRNKIEKDIN